MTQVEEKYRAPALEKGLDIIELLSLHADGLSQRDVAKALERSNSEIYRMLSTLVRRGYVTRSQDDLYSLSLKMFALSQRHPPIERLLEAATPLMRKATRQAWQSCHLAVENNADIVVVASVESPGNWSLALRVGTIIGLGNTSAGRVLAAYRTDAEVGEIIDRHRCATGEPALDPASFLDHVARVRERGYERMASETAVGVTNLAYPILDRDRRAVAAVVCPFLERIDELDVPSVDEAHKIFLELAAELSNYYNGYLAVEE